MQLASILVLPEDNVRVMAGRLAVLQAIVLVRVFPGAVSATDLHFGVRTNYMVAMMYQVLVISKILAQYPRGALRQAT